jgi:hypothetical protein
MQSRAKANGWSLPGFLSDLGQLETVAAQLAGFSVTPTRDGDAQAAMVSAGYARGLNFAGLGRTGAIQLMLANLTASSVSYSPGGNNYPALNETRTGNAWYLDSSQKWQAAGTGVVRDSAYAYSNKSSAFERVTLLELSAKNLVLQSDALATTWTAVGSPVATNAASTKANRSFSSLAYGSAWGTDYVKQAVTFTGNAVKSVTFNIAQNGTDAGTFAIQLYDVTGSASVMTCTVTIASGGGCTAACSTGTLESIVAIADGAYYVKCLSTSVTAAHTMEVRVGTAGTAPSVQLSGIFAGDVLFPTSLVPTTSATVTRNADVSYVDLSGRALSLPRESTWYAKWIDLGSAALGATTCRVFQIGDQSTGNTFRLRYGNTGLLVFETLAGSTAVAATSVLGPALNDECEALCYVGTDGKPHLTLVINGVAGTKVDGSSTTALTAFNDTKVYLNQRSGGSNQGLIGLQAMRATVGNQSLATMQAMP